MTERLTLSAGSADLIQFAAHMARLLYNDATLDDCTEEQKRAWLSAAKALMTIYDIRTRGVAQAVPVAWRWRTSPAHYWALTEIYPGDDVTDVQPLYASKPSPAATVETRTCATCHAVLADGPQPAATYERCSAGNARQLPAYVSNAAREAARDALDDLETNTRVDSDAYTLAQHMMAFARLINEPQTAGMSRDDAQSLVFDLLDAARSFDRAETGFRKDAREYYEEVRDKVIAALSLSRPVRCRYPACDLVNCDCERATSQHPSHHRAPQGE